MTILLVIIMLLLVTQDNLIALTGISFLNYLDEIIIVFLLIMSIINLGKKSTIKKFDFKLLIMILLFAITGIISCYLNSNFIFKDTLMSCFLSTKFWILVLAISLLKVDKSTIDKYYNSLFTIEVIVIIFAIVNILFLEFYKSIFPLSNITYRFGMIAVCSVFSHPGKYGWFMLFCALAHFSLYKKNGNKRDFVKMIISIIACLLSLRTKVIMSIIACFVCYAIYVNRESFKKQIKKIVLVLILSICILIPFKDIVYNTYVLYFTDSEGYSVRQALMDNSLKISKDYFPLGVGFGKYGTWYASQKYSEYYIKYGMSHMYGLTKDNTSYSTDTFWPAIIGETGVIGCIIYIFMIILLIKQLNMINKKKNEADSALSLFALMTMIQIIIESFGSASFNGPPEYFFAAVTIGLAIARYNTIKKGDNNEKNKKHSYV